MNIISWLQRGDAVIQRLTDKYLLDQKVGYCSQGIIGRYLDLFDPKTSTWGGGYYGPKWISTHYTMLELRYMEIAPEDAIYQEGCHTILDHLWQKDARYSKRAHLDMCIVGMMLNMVCYGRLQDDRIEGMIDYILLHPFPDGGWNCTWERKPVPKIASLHTTINVLEGLATYRASGYMYRVDEVINQENAARESLLNRQLFRARKSGAIIHPDMKEFHYPPRWKYDCFRALEYFVDSGALYDSRMDEAIDLVEANLRKGYVNKNAQYSGRVHFQLEESRGGRFNTFRALKILKAYRPDVYHNLLKQPCPFEL
jgi:hypothetical protein